MVCQGCTKGLNALSKQRNKGDFLSAEALTEIGLEFALKGQLKKALAAFNTAIKLDRCRWEGKRT